MTDGSIRRRALRFLVDCLMFVFHDDLPDRLDRIPEHRRARTEALRYAMFRTGPR